jgi:hypothetical protein
MGRLSFRNYTNHMTIPTRGGEVFGTTATQPGIFILWYIQATAIAEFVQETGDYVTLTRRSTNATICVIHLSLEPRRSADLAVSARAPGAQALPLHVRIVAARSNTGNLLSTRPI